MYIALFISIIHFSGAEWEIPEELLPPPELFERIGGFSPFVGFADIPESLLSLSVRNYLLESVHTKYFSIAFDNLDHQSEAVDCSLQYSNRDSCFTNNAGPNLPHSLARVPNELSECTLNSSHFTLLLPDGNGYCSSVDNVEHAGFNLINGKNLTVFCKPHCSNFSQTNEQLKSVLNSQIVADSICTCEDCIPVIRQNEAANVTNVVLDVLFINVAIQNASRIASIKSTLSYAQDNGNCPNFVSTVINYGGVDSTLNTPRFALQRGRFHCPSEITCLWEVLYPFTQDDPFFRPSFLFSAKVVLLAVHVAICEKSIFHYMNKYM